MTVWLGCAGRSLSPQFHSPPFSAQELHHQGLRLPSDRLSRWMCCQSILPLPPPCLGPHRGQGLLPPHLSPCHGHFSTHSSRGVPRRPFSPLDTSNPVMVEASCSCLTLGTSTSLVDSHNPALWSINSPHQTIQEELCFPAGLWQGKTCSRKGVNLGLREPGF